MASAAAKYLGTDATSIAFTDSTTMGLGLVYGGLKLRPGDEVVTTEHDFYSTHESLRLAAARTGATVRRVRLYDDPAKTDADAIVETIRRAVTPRTRAVAVTWVHSSTGVKLPIRRIADALPETALLCVDAVHGFGADHVPITELGADVFVSGCHKWLFGPRGTGIVWARPEAWTQITGTIPTFDASGFRAWFGETGVEQPPGPRMTPGGYHSFEHRWALADAFQFHFDIGPDRVTARTAELAKKLKDGLAGMSHVRLATPDDPELSAGLVCCEIGTLDPATAVTRLRSEHKIGASVTPYQQPLVRFGPSIVNSDDDIEATLKAVRALRYSVVLFWRYRPRKIAEPPGYSGAVMTGPSGRRASSDVNSAAAARGSAASVIARTTTTRSAPAASTSSSRLTLMPPIANHGLELVTCSAVQLTSPSPGAGRPGFVGVGQHGPVQK